MRIMEAHAEGNAAIARRYFGRDLLFLEQMPAPDEPLAQMVLPTDTAALMRDYVAPMIRSLIKQHADTPTKT